MYKHHFLKDLSFNLEIKKKKSLMYDFINVFLVSSQILIIFELIKGIQKLSVVRIRHPSNLNVWTAGQMPSFAYRDLIIKFLDTRITLLTILIPTKNFLLNEAIILVGWSHTAWLLSRSLTSFSFNKIASQVEGC